jgi:adenylyltransferase/sulfurtransferase
MHQDPQNFDRFNRQIALPDIGYDGQEKIHNAKALLIGAGGLGSAAAYYLAAAGISTLGIADNDKVEISNLNRQILHNQNRIGMKKVASAKKTLEKLNPAIEITTYPEKLGASDDFVQLVKNYDIVVDCTDNYQARYAINKTCIEARKPWVYGAVSGFEGQAMTILPNKGPCYDCLYPSPPYIQKENQPPGVIGVSPGLIGVIQATETLKYILDQGSLLVGNLLFADLLEMKFSKFRVTRNKQCKSCGKIIK